MWSLVWETSTRDAIKLAGFVTVLRLEPSEGYWTCTHPCVQPSILGELTWRDVYPVYKVSARNSARPVPRIFREKTFDWFSALLCRRRHERFQRSSSATSIDTNSKFKVAVEKTLMFKRGKFFCLLERRIVKISLIQLNRAIWNTIKYSVKYKIILKNDKTLTFLKIKFRVQAQEQNNTSKRVIELKEIYFSTRILY